jgi:outer membrane protein TolC
MMGTSDYRRRLPLACLAALVVLAGCGPKSYKGDADRRVYRSVDRQWQPEFGPKANYRITGAPASPNDLDAELVSMVEHVVADTRILTIPQAVAIATVHNRDYHLQKERLYTMALEMRLVRHAYETQLFGIGLAEDSKENKKDGWEEKIDAEAGFGFNQLLAIGTQVGVQVGAHWVGMLTGSGDTGLSEVLTATIRQPLLRGNKPRVVLEPLTLAERNALYQIRNFARFRKLVVVMVITQYYQALRLQDTVKNTDAYINSLLALENRVERLVEVALLPVEELDRVRQEILRARDARIVAEKEYDRFLDLLKLTLAVRPTMEFGLDTRVFEALKAKGIPYPDFSLDDAIETALYHRLDLTNDADKVLDAQRGVYVAADGLRPGLDVLGSQRLDTDGSRKVSGGIALDLDHVPEQDQYARALVLLNQRQREYDLTADTIRTEVREAHRKMVETAERYKVLSEGLSLAQERVDKTFAALRYATLSSRRVLNALEHLYDARNQAADALTEYAVANLNFYRDTEILQVRPDGMWEIGPLGTSLAKTTAKTNGSLTRE